MIRQLSGTVVETGLTSVVLDVGGVGYLVFTDSPISYQVETRARFFTHLAVREHSLDLYGFADRDTLEIFELLIELPKIGPKTALQILTAADVVLLKEAARNNDPGYLSKLSGIGKKSAEKIVAGLKDKLESLGYEAVSAGDRSVAGVAPHAVDTIDALIALGYQAGDARRIVIEISSEHPSLASSAETIKLALQRLNR